MANETSDSPVETTKPTPFTEKSTLKNLAHTLRDRVNNLNPRDALLFLTQRTPEDDAKDQQAAKAAAQAAVTKKLMDLQPIAPEPTTAATDSDIPDNALHRAAASDNQGEDHRHKDHDKWKGHNVMQKILNGEA